MNPPLFTIGQQVRSTLDTSLHGKVIAIYTRGPEWTYLVLLDQPSTGTQGWFSESKIT